MDDADTKVTWLDLEVHPHRAASRRSGSCEFAHSIQISAVNSRQSHADTIESFHQGVRSQEICIRYGSSMAQLPAPGCYLLLATLPLLPLLPLSPSKEFRTSLVVFLRDAGEVELVGAIVSGF